jgi:hypothetical protein
MENKKTEFENSFPFKLIPTNLPGVFTRESLPEDLEQQSVDENGNPLYVAWYEWVAPE